MNKDKLFKFYSYTIIYILMTSISMAAIGSFIDNDNLLKLHPYIFFIGFGNLSVLILNKYIISSYYPKLELSPKKQFKMILTIIFSLILITISVYLSIPFLKIIISILLFIIIISSLLDMYKHLTLKEIWNVLTVRFYFIDILFLLNAALGLFALGYKETFPNTSLIPNIVSESLYFLGSSFPLSISTMGFIYAIISKDKTENNFNKFLKIFFNLWFYTFILGVLTFLILIVLDTYWGMMISSSILITGVFLIFLLIVKKIKKEDIILYFLISAISLLLLTGVFGLLNIYFMQGRIFGTRLASTDMWIYQTHVHSALLGWITLSFIAMLYSIYPYILKNKNIKLTKLELSDKQINYLYIQLIVSVISLSLILTGFIIENRYLLLIFGLIFSGSFNITIFNLIKNKK